MAHTFEKSVLKNSGGGGGNHRADEDVHSMNVKPEDVPRMFVDFESLRDTIT